MKLAAETAVQVGGGNDGEGKTLRVSHSPWKSLRDSHIPTAPTTAKLVLKPNPERSFLSHPSNPLSGSSFDWKRLSRADDRSLSGQPRNKLRDYCEGKHSQNLSRKSQRVTFSEDEIRTRAYQIYE